MKETLTCLKKQKRRIFRCQSFQFDSNQLHSMWFVLILQQASEHKRKEKTQIKTGVFQEYLYWLMELNLTQALNINKWRINLCHSNYFSSGQTTKVVHWTEQAIVNMQLIISLSQFNVTHFNSKKGKWTKLIKETSKDINLNSLKFTPSSSIGFNVI
jgi:hypothetical protein